MTHDRRTSTEGLRTGITTGTCAAAAAKAAALAIGGEVVASVDVRLPDGELLTVPVARAERTAEGVGRASVVKDSGDDPDVTNGMTVEATVEAGGEGVRFAAGEGVGVVTRPGLLLAPGEPAINPVPRRMIAEAVEDVLGETGALVTVSIPGGAEAAAGTFNPRLGIEGGLSVIGTSGRVVPKSSDAWMRSLLPQVDVAVAAGHRTVWLTTGGRGDAFATGVLGAPEAAVVQASNFVGALLDRCAEAGVERVVLVGHAGKLLKVAAGLFDTHSRHGDARMETLAAVAAAEGAPGPLAARLLEATTVEAAVAELEGAGLADVWDAVAERVARRASARCGLPVDAVLIGYHDDLLGASAGSGRARERGRGGLTVVGVGPGAEDTLTPEAWRAIRRADVCAGGARQLAAFAPEGSRRVAIGADVGAALREVRDLLAGEGSPDRRAVVLASGDPGFFGVLDAIRRELPDMDLRVIPGVSSVQAAAARLGVSWHGAALLSGHGRDAAAVAEEACRHERAFALTDRANPPERLAALLGERGAFEIAVVERLGTAEERVTRGTAHEIAEGRFDPLSVVAIERRAES